jgi:hypothetical protein
VAATAYSFGGEAQALWRLDNLDADALAWAAREFGYAPFRCLAQVGASARAGYLVTTGKHAELPRNLLACTPPDGTRVALLAGMENRFFLPSGQEKTFEHFDALQPGRHSLIPVPRYAHYDLYIGRNAYDDVFETIVGVLEGHSP